MFITRVDDVMRNKICDNEIEELRWKLVKAMLDDFPQLRQHVKAYLNTEKHSNFFGKASIEQKSDFKSEISL
jgi:hypothetical protein